MRKIGFVLSALAVGGLLVSMTAPEAQAQKSRAKRRTAPQRVSTPRLVSSEPSMEKGLLGIRLLQTYEAVLQRYGQPDRIYRIGEPVLFDYVPDAEGNSTGGIRGLSDATTTAGGGAMGGGPSAASAAGGGGGGKLGGMMGGGRPGGGGGAPSGPPPGVMSRYGGYASAGGGGAPSGPPPGVMSRYGGGGGSIPGGGGGVPGAPGSGGGGSLAGGGNNGEEQTFGESGGFIWVYLNRGEQTARMFVFNKDKRVEVIGQFGRIGTMSTSRGIHLGSSISNLYATYGWPDSGEESERGTSLYYLQKYHTQFDTLKNRVVSVIVALRENQKVRTAKNANGGGAAGGGGRMAGGGGGGGRTSKGGGSGAANAD